MLAELLDLDAGRVGGVGDVDHDRRVGRERERRGARAAEGDLLLGDRDGVHLPGGAAGLGHEPRGLQRDERADAVVQRARDQPPAEQADRIGVDHGDVADAHVLARLLAVSGADVDVQLADLGDLLAVLLAQQVDRLLADDAPTTPSRVARATR